jgi:general secretion pathway protein F
MPSFKYEALDATGRKIAGVMDGESQAAIIQELNRAGLFPIGASEATATHGRTWRQILTPEPTPAEITAITLDLVMLLKGGVTLSEALHLLTQFGGGRWRVGVMRDLHLAINSGKTFSKALSEHPRLFPPVYIKMAEVAEATGRLEDALTSLAEERQRSERLRKRILGALAYPAFLVVSALCAITFIFLYVIPQFATALEGYRDKIDPSALAVFDASDFLRVNIQSIGMGAGLAILAAFAVTKAGEGSGMWLSLAAKLPAISTIFRYDTTVKFCRTLAVLTGNGVDITSTLRLLRDTVSLPAHRAEIDGVVADVRKGRRLFEALEAHPFLPKHVMRMLRVGEESGRLTDSANRVSSFYEARLDSAFTRIIAVTGPLTMMMVSMLIAWLIISVMTALMSVNDMLK